MPRIARRTVRLAVLAFTGRAFPAAETLSQLVSIIRASIGRGGSRAIEGLPITRGGRQGYGKRGSSRCMLVFGLTAGHRVTVLTICGCRGYRLSRRWGPCHSQRPCC